MRSANEERDRQPEPEGSNEPSTLVPNKDGLTWTRERREGLCRPRRKAIPASLASRGTAVACKGIVVPA